MLSILPTFVRLLLAGSALLAAALHASAGQNYYATPAGAGAQNGTSWTDAWPQAQIQAAVNGLAAGDTLNLGSGTYTITSLVITGSGAPGSPKSIVGVDTGGGRPLFQGNFNIANDAGGARFIHFPGAAHYWTLRNLAFRKHPWVINMSLVASGNDTLRSNLVFDTLSFDTIEDAIRIYNANHVEVVNCTAIRYTKKAFRAGDHTSFLTFRASSADCTGGDPTFIAKAIPVGFGGDDTDGLPIIHDIDFIDCIASNNGYPQGGSNYWNGDGFSTERGTYNVRFIRCEAYDNNDGGFDNKATDVLYQDCVSVGNSRGYRHWAGGGQMVNSVAAFNAKRGGTGGAYGVWVSGNGGGLNIDSSTFHGGGAAAIVDSGGLLTVNNSILSIHGPGTGFVSGAVGLSQTVMWSTSTGIDPAYTNPDPAWRGSPANAMDSGTYGLTKGYNSTRIDTTPNSPPTLVIAATGTGGLVPYTVAFTAEAADTDGTLVGYAWSFGNGQTSSEQNPTITYHSPGTFTVNCSVVDNRGAMTTQTVTIVASMPTTPVPIRIEAGSAEPYTDGLGRVWAGDYGFTGGGMADRGTLEIAGTTDDRLYQTERWEAAGYSFILANGLYEVRLHLAETFAGIAAAGQRVFSVTAEGTSPTGWSDIDIFAEAGANTALVKSGIVAVTDNYLDLAFTASVNSPLVSAIEILPVAGGDLPPVPPAGLAFSAATTNSFEVSWAPATDDVGVVSYDVFRDGVLVGSTTGLSLPVTGLAPYTTYRITVRARDTVGNGSVPSAPLFARTLDDGTTGGEIIVDNAAAIGVTTTGAWNTGALGIAYYGPNYLHDGNVDKGAKSVRFTPDVPVAATYSVYVRWPAGANRANNVPIDVIHASGTTTKTYNQRVSDGVWVLHGTYAFAAGMTHGLLVRTNGTNGFVVADAVRFVREAADTTAPSVPAGLAATSITSSAFTLSWAAATDDIGVTGYDVFRDGVQIGTATGTSLPVTGLTPYTNYSLTVRARDAAGNPSAQSAPLIVRTLDTDTGAGGAEIILDNTSAVGVTITGDWIAATTAGGFYGSNYLQDNNADKGTKSVRYTPDIPVAASYTVYVRWTAGSNRANNVPIDVTHANGTTTQMFNQRASGGVWVSHGVYAFAAGTSNSVLLRTTDTNGFVIADAVRLVRVAAGSDTTPPSVPAGLSAGSITSDAFALSWTASTDAVGVTGYEVFLDGLSRGAVTGTSANVTGLAPATTYSATVRARDAAGNWSAVSDALSVTTVGVPTDAVPPTPPTGLAASGVSAVTFSLSWTASTDNLGVTGYGVFRNGVSLGTTAATNFNVAGLAAATTYAMTVQARDAAGNWSVLSDVLSVTTANSPGGGSTVNGRVISLNLSDGSTNSLAPGEIVGAVPVANWNNSAGTNVAVSNALDDQGTVTTADLTFTNANFGYTNSTTGTNGDARMMKGQRGLSNGSTMTATAAQVPYATYDIYVYWGGRATGESVPATMTVNLQQWTGAAWATVATKYIRDGNRAWDGTFNESTAEVSTDAVDGNEYVVFRGRTDVTFRISATQATRSGISGYQIVEQVPVQTGSAPVITSAASAAGEYGAPFNYAIAATESPTEFGATGLPAGLALDAVTGVISGVPVAAGSFEVALSATNATGTGSATLTLAIARSGQVITFEEVASKSYGDEPFELAAISDSGLPVAYAIVSGPATLDGNLLTITGAGTIVVAASQPGDDHYLPAEAVEVSIFVAQAEQAISLDAPEEKTFGDAPFAVSATASSGLPVILAIDSGPATLSGGMVTIQGAGTVVLTATQAGDDNFLPAETIEFSIGISRAEQALTFPAPGAKTFGDAPFALAATASSGLPVGYSVVSGPASITGNLVTLLGAGNVVIAAEQPGDANHFAADQVTRSFEVAKATQTITFPNPGAKIYGDAPFALLATASSGLSVSYVVTSGPATLNGSTVTLTGAGTVVLTAVQAGDADHTAAEPVSVTLQVSPANAMIVLDDLWLLYDGTPKPVTVTTTPVGLSVTITYAGSATPPTYPGSYAVEVVSNEANYTASASGTLVIGAGITVRHAPVLNGTVEGSLQVLLPESVVLNGSASVAGDLLMPGTPSIRLNGQPAFGGTLDGPGAAGSASHQVTLNGGARLRHVVRRIDAVGLPAVPSPVATTGTRYVSLNNGSQSPDDFATIRNLTLNSNAGVRSVPPGAYDTFTANGNAGFILGVEGATEPSVYSFQSLVLNGNSQVQVVGPILLLLANTLSLNGYLGTAAEPERLIICVANGGVTLNGGTQLHAIVQAPNGTVTVNGNALLRGSVIADRLTVNGNGIVRGPEQD